MGRDRFVKIEWGDRKGNNSKGQHEFGFCDHGHQLATREEAEVYWELKAKGYTVHKHGWPDFMATRGEEVRLIEVKSSADYQRESQRVVHAGLRRRGIEVETIIRFNPHRPQRIFTKPAPIRRRTE